MLGLPGLDGMHGHAASCALVTVAALAASLGAQVRWQPVPTANTPAARSTHAIVDAGPLGVLLFGGETLNGTSALFLSDTWRWTGSDWSQLAVGPAPARSSSPLCYDPLHNEVVMFGGWSQSGYQGDTWTFDGATWTRRNPTTSPPLLSWHGMEFDRRSGRVILFGGWIYYANPPVFSDTWAWDGTDWTPLSPAHTPPRRCFPVMAWHGVRNAIVLHGGMGRSGTSNVCLSDTWEWTGNDWSLIPTRTSPPPRGFSSFAYDYVRRRLVMVGGHCDTSTTLTDVWEFDGDDWHARAPQGTTPPVNQAAAFFDSARRELVLFGGSLTAPWRNVISSATDSYGPLRIGGSTYVGSGCSGAPHLDASELAWAGGTYVLGAYGAAPGSSLALLVGFSRTATSGGVRLPLNLAPVGMPGCSLLVDPLASATVVVDGSGQARLSLPVPAQSSLVGAWIYAQGVAASAGTNAAGLVTTNGVGHRLGGI